MPKDDATRERVLETSESLVRDLETQGVEVLWDDRADVSPGEKFADADLLGMPLRLVVSEKSLKEDSVEWKLRSSKDSKLVKQQDIVEEAKNFVTER